MRGEFRPIATNVPGIEMCEHLPLQATIADKLAIVRNMTFQQPDHKLHEIYTGFPDGRRPAAGVWFGGESAAAGAAGRSATLHEPGPVGPPYTVAMAEKPEYLGIAHGPFGANRRYRDPKPAAGPRDDAGPAGPCRESLLKSFDHLRRAWIRASLAGLDAFQAARST